MFNHHPPSNRKTTVRQPRSSTTRNAAALPVVEHDVVALQRVIGNRATIRHLNLLQRLPDSAAMIVEAGKPKKKSTKYRTLLAALDAYNDYIKAKPIGARPVQVRETIQVALNLLTDVTKALDPLKAKIDEKGVGRLKGTKTKRQAMLDLVNKVLQERANLIMTQSRYAGGKAFASGIPTIKVAMTSDYQSATMELRQNQQVGADRGGSNEVTEYDIPQMPGFFKANKSEFAYKSIEDLMQGEAPINARALEANNKKQRLAEVQKLLQDSGDAERYVLEGYEQEIGELQQQIAALEQQNIAPTALHNFRQTEYSVGVEQAGVDPRNARMANREIAMSRIDQLLGSNLVTRAQLAIQHTDVGNVQGVFMEKAVGRTLQMAATGHNGPQFKEHDATLMRELSKLQLLDLLCAQVDRNFGNVFVQMDGNGNVTSIKGIDNDYALGTQTDINSRHQELPGISQYVDSEMAERILQLDADILRNLLTDLLTNAELDALINRLNQLKVMLKQLKDQKLLLKPDQWTQAVSQNIFTEGKKFIAATARNPAWWSGSEKSYYGKAMGKRGYKGV